MTPGDYRRKFQLPASILSSMAEASHRLGAP
jgi:hypothetical protein